MIMGDLYDASLVVTGYDILEQRKLSRGECLLITGIMFISGSAKAESEVVEGASKVLADTVVKESGKVFGTRETEAFLDGVSGITGSNRDRLLSVLQNGELKSIVNELYRPGATLADGGTASALAQEFYEGSSKHLQKAKDRLRQLNNLAESGNLGLNDLDIVDALRMDLENSIKSFD